MDQTLSTKYTDQQVNDIAELAARFLADLDVLTAQKYIYERLLQAIASKDKYAIDACLEYRDILIKGKEVLNQSKYYGARYG